MDRIFRKGKFWVDSIFDVNRVTSRALVIPDINSEDFPPWLTRTIEFPTSRLEPGFYESRMRADARLEPLRTEFSGGIVQGQYYDISRQISRISRTRSKHYSLANIDLNRAKMESPVNDDIPFELQSPEVLNSGRTRGIDQCRLYCFNVGQGDSSLLVVNGHAYLIDTNIYAGKKLDSFLRIVSGILGEEGFEPKIKALIITHKHLDHLRGAHRLLGVLPIEKLILNQKYKHSTKAVKAFLDSAEKHISPDNWVDASEPFTVVEGNFELEFVNPTKSTNSKKGAPDINDSSIVFTVTDTRNPSHGKFVLTGDASFPILERVLSGNGIEHSILKVSHHGSRTGTSWNLVNSIIPIAASISAGNSKKYKHPHDKAKDILKPAIFPNKLLISKYHRKTVRCDLKTMDCYLV